MATVRFSKELIERIVKQATAKMHPAIVKAQGQKPDNSWGQRIYDTLFLEVQPIIAQLPAGWVKHTKQIQIDRIGEWQCNMTFEFAAPQPWPHEFLRSELARKASAYGEGIVLEEHLVWGEFHAEVTAYWQRVAEATKRRDEFVDAVKSICNTYSTLAPALKAWPPLWELIPEDVKSKHREIVAREKKEVVLDVDIGKLTAMSTAAKFGL
jgi:hypothetical protein